MHDIVHTRQPCGFPGGLGAAEANETSAAVRRARNFILNNS